MKKLSLLLGLFLLLSIGMTSKTFAQNQELLPTGIVYASLNNISCITDATGYSVRITVKYGGLGGNPESYVQPFVVGKKVYLKQVGNGSYIATYAQLLYQGEVVSLGGTEYLGYVYYYDPVTVHVDGPCPGGND